MYYGRWLTAPALLSSCATDLTHCRTAFRAKGVSQILSVEFLDYMGCGMSDEEIWLALPILSMLKKGL